MTLENDIKELRTKVGRLPGENTALGVLIAAIASIGSCVYSASNYDMLKRSRLDTDSVRMVKVKDVIGDSKPEAFYEFNGQRFYIEIDGESIESYLRHKVPGFMEAQEKRGRE